MPSPAELVAALSRAYALTDVFPGGDPVSLDALGHLRSLLSDGVSVEVGTGGLRVDGIEVPDFHGRSGRFARDLRALGVDRIDFHAGVSVMDLERLVRTLRDDVVGGWGGGLRALRGETGGRVVLTFDGDDEVSGAAGEGAVEVVPPEAGGPAVDPEPDVAEPDLPVADLPEPDLPEPEPSGPDLPEPDLPEPEEPAGVDLPPAPEPVVPGPSLAGPVLVQSITDLFHEPWDAADSGDGPESGEQTPPEPESIPFMDWPEDPGVAPGEGRSTLPEPPPVVEGPSLAGFVGEGAGGALGGDDADGLPREWNQDGWLELEEAFAAGIPDPVTRGEVPPDPPGDGPVADFPAADLAFLEDGDPDHAFSFLDDEDPGKGDGDPGMDLALDPPPPAPSPLEPDAPDIEVAPPLGWGDPLGGLEDSSAGPGFEGAWGEPEGGEGALEGFVPGSEALPGPGAWDAGVWDQDPGDPDLIDVPTLAPLDPYAGDGPPVVGAPAGPPLSAGADEGVDPFAGTDPGQLPVARLVDHLLSGSGAGRATAAAELRRRSASSLRPGVLDDLTEAVARLVEGGEQGVPGAGEMAVELATPAVTSRIAARLGHDRDPAVRQRLMEVAAALGDPMARALGDALSDDPERSARRAYLDALVALGPVGRAAVDAMLADGRWFVVRNGVAILGEVGGADAPARLAPLLEHADPRVRREALMSLARCGGDEAPRLVERMLDDGQAEVRSAAAVALGALRVGRALPRLHALLDSEKEQGVVEAVVGALGVLGDPVSVPLLERKASSSLFSRTPSEVRIAALRALHAIGTPAARAAVEGARNDRDVAVREAARGLH